MAIGDITNAVVSSSVFSGTDVVSEYEVTRLFKDYYAVVYSLNGYDAVLGTFHIEPDGSAITAIDTWTIQASASAHMDVEYIGNNTMVLVAYSSTIGSAIHTVKVNDNGTLIKTFVDSTALDTSAFPYGANILRVPNSNYYIFSYRWQGSDNSFRIKTFEVTPTGTISAEIDNITMAASSYGKDNDVVHVRNNMYAVSWLDSTQQGHLATFSCDPTDGTLSALLDETTSMTGASLCWENCLTVPYPDFNIVALTYRGTGSDGYIQTAWIDVEDGTITLLDNLEFDNNNCVGPRVFNVDNAGAIGVVYRGYSAGNGTNEGEISTFQIATDGSIGALDNWEMGIYTVIDHPAVVPVGPTQSNLFVIAHGTTSSGYGTLSVVEIEGPLTTTVESELGLFAPVSAYPVITSGRNTSGYSTGHEAKFVLDNDPDTYYEPDSTSDTAIYIDLGTAVSVDAMVFWLHNYNALYKDNRSWRVSYSSDDSTYTTLQEWDFETYRPTYTPVVVDKFNVAITARYWRLELFNFDELSSLPDTLVPQIGGVWLCNDYSLQQPEIYGTKQTRSYTNTSSIMRSGERRSSSTTAGHYLRIERKFTFTAAVNQWDNLYAAYCAVWGSCRPVFLQAMYDSDIYYGMTFETALDKNTQEEGTYTPSVVLQELGHERISYYDRSLVSPWYTAAVWHFDGNAEDSGLYGRDLTENSAPPYTTGICKQNAGAVDTSNSGNLTIASGSASWANMDTSNFTIEAWVRGVDGMLICKKGSGSYSLSGAGYSLTSSGPKFRVSLHDGTHTVNAAVGAIMDSDWHYWVLVVDRTNNEMRCYTDGTLLQTIDISSITGSLDNSEDLEVGTISVSDQEIDELVLTKGYAMTTTEVVARYAGCVDYGIWGM